MRVVSNCKQFDLIKTDSKYKLILLICIQMTILLEEVTKYLKEKGQDVPDNIKKLISSRNWSDMTCIVLERLFNHR